MTNYKVCMWNFQVVLLVWYAFFGLSLAWPLDMVDEEYAQKFIGVECTLMHLGNSEDFGCKMETDVAAKKCGGVSISPNSCMMYDHGTFAPITDDELLGADEDEDAVLRFRRKAEQWTSNPRTPWCDSVEEATTGAFLATSLGRIVEQDIRPLSEDKGGERFHGSDGEFVSKSCRLLPLNHGAILKAFGGKCMLWMGDSKMRNFLTAFMAADQQRAYVAEMDGKTIQYSMGPLGSRMKLIDDQWEPQTTPGARRPNKVIETNNKFTPCKDLGLGSPCLDVVNVWAPTFKTQLELTKPLMRLVKPQVIWTSVNNHDNKISMDPRYENMWKEIFKNSNLDAWAFILWPHGNTLASDRTERVLALIENAPKSIRKTFLNLWDIQRNLASEQLRTAKHDVCSVEYKSIGAVENCTGTFSRAVDRVLLTLSRPM
mmetsp:Transcript_1475/g.2114  ORF Transcript_1475/g.2114 Transcript_1475/m.2114 type:complete len:429 (-) Transcript_1475:49-1335(-)